LEGRLSYPDRQAVAGVIDAVGGAAFSQHHLQFPAHVGSTFPFDVPEGRIEWIQRWPGATNAEDRVDHIKQLESR